MSEENTVTVWIVNETPTGLELGEIDVPARDAEAMNRGESVDTRNWPTQRRYQGTEAAERIRAWLDELSR